jgi:hypothetical protein
MRTPRPKLRDRTSVDSERADVREGSPLPVGTQKSVEDSQAYRLSTRSSAILLVRRAPGTKGK